MAFGLSLCIGEPLSSQKPHLFSTGQKVGMVIDIALVIICTAAAVLIILSRKGIPIGPLNAVSSFGKIGVLGFGAGAAFLVLWDFVALLSQIPDTLKSLHERGV